MNASIIIPAKNEEQGLSITLPKLCRLYPQAEVIVVDDGSTDATVSVCEKYGVCVVSHPYSKGNGAAIKSGARSASRARLVFMDADGQHDPEDIEKLLLKLNEGYEMVVGSRSGVGDQASVARWGANTLYNKLASWMVNYQIDDLTSGFRAVDREKFLDFLYLLPNGFSYPTTITMAFFRAGYSVGFAPISVGKRLGTSHINIVRDGVRFFLIIFKIGTLYSPLKVYFPMSAIISGLGVLNYVVANLSSGSWRFTNMSTLLLLTGITVFLIGLLAEQLTNLQYKDSDGKGK